LIPELSDKMEDQAMSENETVVVRLTEEEERLCKAYAEEVATHYGSGTKMEAMPWSGNQLTDGELRQWLNSRQEAGQAINIETCELGCWCTNLLDPYRILEALGVVEDLCIGRCHFVRSPETNGWVYEDDLPLSKIRTLHDRIEREWQAYCRSNPNDRRGELGFRAASSKA
jgi:hypothetical protein